MGEDDNSLEPPQVVWLIWYVLIYSCLTMFYVQ